MASFGTLPRELRQEIYSYLLVDHNVVKLEASKTNENLRLTPYFSTSLFLVNKQISEEAIWYFYRQNAFILVEWLPVLKEAVAECHECCIMKKVSVSRLELKRPTDERFALSIRLCYPFCGLDWETPKGQFSVISSSQFCKLVKLLNGRHWEYLQMDSIPYVKVSLNISCETPFYKGNQSLRNQLLGSIGLLKGSRMDNGELPESPAKKVLFHIQGNIDNEQAKAIQDQSEQLFRLADLFQYSRGFLDLAKDLFDQGFLAEAKGAYCAVFVTVSEIARRDLNDEEYQEYYLVDLERHIQTSHILSKLNYTSHAVREAYEALRHWRSPPNRLPMTPYSPMSSKQFGDRIAKALTDDGLLGSIATFYKNVKESWTERKHDNCVRTDLLLLENLVREFWPGEINS